MSVKIHELDKESLWKLRKEIVLNSLFIHDYDNSFGFDPRDVCTFFDGFIEHVDTMEREENQVALPILDLLKKYDNPDALFDWYSSIEDWDWFRYTDNKKQKHDMEKQEKRRCIRCDAELEEVPKDQWHYPSFEDEGCHGSVMELRCPQCGAYHSVSDVEEEDRENYPAYNPELAETFVDADHGYAGHCPKCGNHVVWSGDFMRSEVWCDTEVLDENGKPIHDEYGCDPDDALVTYVMCPYCGASIEIVDAKQSELDEMRKAGK